MAGSETVVIVGGGLAAGKAVETLTDSYPGRVVLISAERHLPYERPPLSKGYLLDQEPLEKVFVQPQQWYDERNVDLRLDTTVTEVDLGAHTVSTATGQTTYDRLLMATGAAPRRLQTADSGGAPVAYLRTIDDSTRIKEALRPGGRIAIVGGGWIGLEVAAAARAAGCDVVVLEALSLPLVRVLGREVAEIFASLHRSHGVDLRTNASVASVEAADSSAVVHLGDGSSVSADLLVVGIGVAPVSGLAERCGLRVDDGIEVDEYLQTSDPDVFAAGDVANAYHPALGRRLRVEHWDNAIAQGRTAATNLLGGREAYTRLPYFFTDQYDLGMEYVGSVGPAGYDEVVLRGDPSGYEFTAFWLAEGTVVAGMHANDWDAIDPVRRIVSAGRVDLDALRDPAVDLAQVGTD